MVSRVMESLDTVCQHAPVDHFHRRHQTGLLTLLFTDVAGSTQLKQALGEREAVALIQRHRADVRELLGRLPDGEEIETAGDSFLLVFAKPSAAVRFALMLQGELRQLANSNLGADAATGLGCRYSEDVDQVGAFRVDVEAMVEGDQPPKALAHHFHKVGVVHLLVTEGFRIEVGIRCWRHRPELVVCVTQQVSQERRGFTRADGVRRVGRIGRKPDKPQLCKANSRPPMPGLAREPAMGLGMVLMIRPGKRKQHIEIQERRLHIASSASSPAARLLGMMLASDGTLKTGRPFFVVAFAWACKPRRARCERTCPSCLPEACARHLAASNTSSSRVTVVLIL